MSVTAIIPAAGMGKRMGGVIPKPFLWIGGRPILAHTLDAFERCDSVDEVILVVGTADLQLVSEEVVDRYEFTKVRKILSGGEKRQDSVWEGLKAVEAGTEIVVIHDGVRPFVAPEHLSESIGQCRKCGAVITAVPVKDTIKEAEDGLVTGTLDREKLWAIQTPQTFALDLILRAHQQAFEARITATDDAALVERLGHPVHLLRGSYHNIKITTPEDLELGEMILSQIGATEGMKRKT
ncbi:MAG: 2-C-methyl-D-erythritol 4-phosphate cytidylyltransferase [Candidatus Latescibacteria bacterium]|nr:2-C-methyl-D-erythritol 4-phosphate cytidylyltransferase [Candidatus Latescibacterota bacterium]